MGKKNSFDKDMIRELAELLAEVDLTEIEIEQDDLRVRVSRNYTQSGPTIVSAPQAAPTQQTSVSAEPSSTNSAPAANAVTSPMVGTVYLAAEPGSPPFVSVGDKVSKGQTLLIVEAMKTMNPIAAPAAGTVKEILVQNEQPVEYGEGLIVID